ncbi:type I restriction-modification system subunit M [Spirochaetia bacterium]|nr:type I restriction-modification system subunit M [Spirochaetia bacterium]
MAVKKSEIYSSLWEGCDELRGSMDASQYKDYVLVLLFMKYVSDKKDPRVELKKGSTFQDMLAYRGKANIGEAINTIIGAFAKNNGLTGIITEADFDDSSKLGSGKEKIDLLTNLLNIFNKDELDFSRNRADGDDLLGDAYEYLMRHFATESGKSKGQFYTPSEVSRVMAELIGISGSKTNDITIYDPTCGSGSLLLKAADAAPNPRKVAIYGQENDNATRALAVMNMWLHNFSDAEIEQGNTLASPQFKDEKTGGLKTFNYAVSNPPFSYKRWMNGIDPENDIYKRFEGYSIPPQKNGDYAFLLHLVKSLKSNGKGCIVMPLGVLFRGNAEAEIRRKLIERGYIKAIIGLPANLFFGTGIAASLIVIEKEDADVRKNIFMIDASHGFIKDGNKNRLREQDIHKIVDAFKGFIEIPKYSRIVPISEIADKKNDYNLNIPRYIDSQEQEDVQNIQAHISGGIPIADIEDLSPYWKVFPGLRNTLFELIKNSGNDTPRLRIKAATDGIKDAIFTHDEFKAHIKKMSSVFAAWQKETAAYVKALNKGMRPKAEIKIIGEKLLAAYHNKPLCDKYTIYQHLMDYWTLTMQDDFYEISEDGWKAGKDLKRLEKKTKKGSTGIPGIEGLEGRLIPPALIVSEYFSKEQKAIDDLTIQVESLESEMETLADEHGGEDGLLSNAVDEKGKITKKTLAKAIKDLGKKEKNNADEWDMLEQYKKLLEGKAAKEDAIGSLEAELEAKVISQYTKLTVEDIKTIVVDKKWLASMRANIQKETDNISSRLTTRIKGLAERYAEPLPEIEKKVEELERKVKNHLKKMGIEY